MFLTTLLNPKGLIFAFAVYPPGNIIALAPYAALFSMIVLVCGGGWIALGALASRKSQGYLARARIVGIAAVTLVLFGALMAGTAIAPFFT